MVNAPGKKREIVSEQRTTFFVAPTPDQEVVLAATTKAITASRTEAIGMTNAEQQVLKGSGMQPVLNERLRRTAADCTESGLCA